MSRSDEPSRSSSGQAVQPAPQPQNFLDWVRDLLHLKPAASIREELESALQSGNAAILEFSPEERAMLKNILDLREVRVHDVMVPRADIIAVPDDINLCDLLRRFEEAEHSRLPVYGETLDELKGMVHIKDLLRYLTRNALNPAAPTERLDLGGVDLSLPLAMAGLIRQVLYVPPSIPAIGLLARMQATRIHMALVIDEHGGTDGLLTIEDVVETVVGDIEDEHDEVEEPLIETGADGTFVADARAPLEEVLALIGPTFELGEAAEEVDTLGGLLVNLAGRVPVQGEVVPGPGGVDFEILEADPRRLKRVRIIRRLPEPSDDNDASSLADAGAQG